MEAKFEELIEGYITGNIGISEEFISKNLAAALLLNLQLLNKNNLMQQAGIGNNSTKDTLQNKRRDSTCWMDDKGNNSAEMEFMDIVHEFMRHLNRTCYTGLNTCEFHYALYEEGSFYTRHKDQFKNDTNRKFTLINYLNTNWIPIDGGQLIVYQEDSILTILPENRKAVFFKSENIEHEVAITKRIRMSITGWLKT